MRSAVLTALHYAFIAETLADNLAEAIPEIIGANATGVYHTAGSERISRYDFAMEMAEVFGLDRS